MTGFIITQAPFFFGTQVFEVSCFEEESQLQVIILLKTKACATAVIGQIVGNIHLGFRADKQMDVGALDSEIAGKNILVFKGHHGLISFWKKDMITEQVQSGKEERGKKIRA